MTTHMDKRRSGTSTRVRPLHVRQKEPAPSAEVRRTTSEVVRAPPDTFSYVARQVLHAQEDMRVKPLREPLLASRCGPHT